MNVTYVVHDDESKFSAKRYPKGEESQFERLLSLYSPLFKHRMKYALCFVVVGLRGTKAQNMASQTASIQSFFQPEVPSSFPSQRQSADRKADTGDGFTSSEVEGVLHPTLHKWQLRANYEAVDIGSLVPGPSCVVIVGRVVNFYDQPNLSKMPQAAKGCLKILVRDNTGAFAVSV